MALLVLDRIVILWIFTFAKFSSVKGIHRIVKVTVSTCKKIFKYSIVYVHM